MNEIGKIMNVLKENMYIPSTELLQEYTQKNGIVLEEKMSLKESLGQKYSHLESKEFFKMYYELLIFKECSTLEGLCHYLTYAKNIILDRKSGALSTDH